VNEMTWPDQQSIEILKRKLDDAIQHADPKERRTKLSRIIVVHNFKQTTTIADFDALRKKYPLQTRNLEGELVEIFEEESIIAITHVFLAKESSEGLISPAGENFNTLTFKYLRNILNTMSVSQKEEHLFQLSDCLHEAIEPYFLQEIAEVAYFVNENGDIKLRAIATVKEGEDKMLRLTRDEIETDGFHLFLASPAIFQTPLDIIKGEEAMIVNVDLPGFMSSSTASEYKNYPCSLKVNVEKDELLISGERKLYFQTYNDGASVAKICYPYSKNNVEDPKLKSVLGIERKQGKFSRKIKIPSQYTTNIKEMKFDMNNGRLQVFIPKGKEGNTSIDI